MSSTSSESCHATPIRRQASETRSASLVGQPGEHGAEPPGRGDQRPGLLGDDVHVVVERVLARPYADRFKQLPVDEAAERLRLDPDGLRAEVGEDPGSPREQVVAGEDSDRVTETRVGRLMTAADRCLVHDVVVEQGRQVRQLDGDRGGHDPLVAAVTEPGREQHEHGPEALAPGLHHVPGNLGEHLVPAEGGVPQGCFDDGEVPGHLRGQSRVGEVDGKSDGHTNSMSSACLTPINQDSKRLPPD